MAAGNFAIGSDCLKNIQEKRRKQDEQKYQSTLKAKEEYDNLLAEVNAVRALNKAPSEWSVSQLRTMVKWYKRDELDKAMPGKKTDLLTRYQETSSRGDRPAPPLPPALLPPVELENIDEVGTNNLLLLASSLPPLSPQNANELDDGIVEEV